MTKFLSTLILVMSFAFVSSCAHHHGKECCEKGKTAKCKDGSCEMKKSCCDKKSGECKDGSCDMKQAKACCKEKKACCDKTAKNCKDGSCKLKKKKS